MPQEAGLLTSVRTWFKLVSLQVCHYEWFVVMGCLRGVSNLFNSDGHV